MIYKFCSGVYVRFALHLALRYWESQDALRQSKLFRQIDKSPMTAIMPQGSLNHVENVTVTRSASTSERDMTQIYFIPDIRSRAERGMEFCETEKQMQTAFVPQTLSRLSKLRSATALSVPPHGNTVLASSGEYS